MTEQLRLKRRSNAVAAGRNSSRAGRKAAVIAEVCGLRSPALGGRSPLPLSTRLLVTGYSELDVEPQTIATGSSQLLVVGYEAAGVRAVAVGTLLRHRPLWQPDTRRLYLDGLLVKELRQPSKNQEPAFAAFELAGWPEHIDDPFPPDLEVDPRERLHNTLRRLNHQARPLICFSADGRGRGICWRRR